MNAPALAPLRLLRIDPAVARTRSAALAALHGRAIGADRLVMAIATAGEADAWVVCAGGIAVAPVAVAGRRPDLCADDGRPDAVAALAALAAIEPLLAGIETALGIGLRPEALAAAPPAEAVIMGVTAGPARLLLAMAPGIALRPAPVVADDAADAVRARWRLHLPGPALAQRFSPAAGDLLTGIVASGWIGVAGHALPVRLARGESARSGFGLLVSGRWRRTMDDEQAAGFHVAAAALPVTVSIDGATAPIGELARLAPGSVLALPGDPARLAVTVLAGGAALASGTLVAVGDGHGVLIDRVFGAG